MFLKSADIWTLSVPSSVDGAAPLLDGVGLCVAVFDPSVEQPGALPRQLRYHTKLDVLRQVLMHTDFCLSDVDATEEPTPHCALNLPCCSSPLVVPSTRALRDDTPANAVHVQAFQLLPYKIKLSGRIRV